LNALADEVIGLKPDDSNPNKKPTAVFAPLSTLAKGCKEYINP